MDREGNLTFNNFSGSFDGVAVDIFLRVSGLGHSSIAMAVEREMREKMTKKEGIRPNKERGKTRGFWSTVLFDYIFDDTEQ